MKHYNIPTCCDTYAPCALSAGYCVNPALADAVLHLSAVSDTTAEAGPSPARVPVSIAAIPVASAAKRQPLQGWAAAAALAASRAAEVCLCALVTYQADRRILLQGIHEADGYITVDWTCRSWPIFSCWLRSSTQDSLSVGLCQRQCAARAAQHNRR